LRDAVADKMMAIVLERLKQLMKTLFPTWFPDSLKVHYVVTEYDLANPTVVVEVTHHHTELAPDTDLLKWAQGPWPPPRYSVEIAGVRPVFRPHIGF
jgi:hypothetical protein